MAYLIIPTSFPGSFVSLYLFYEIVNQRETEYPDNMVDVKQETMFSLETRHSQVTGKSCAYYLFFMLVNHVNPNLSPMGLNMGPLVALRKI